MEGGVARNVARLPIHAQRADRDRGKESLPADDGAELGVDERLQGFGAHVAEGGEFGPCPMARCRPMGGVPLPAP